MPIEPELDTTAQGSQVQMDTRFPCSEPRYNQTVDSSDIAIDGGEAPMDDELHCMVSHEDSIIDGGILADRWILDPGSNTHVINSETWTGWTK
jgi:hypothetical protein